MGICRTLGLLLLFLLPELGAAQQIHISYQEDHTDLISVFKNLESRYGILFAYQADDVPQQKFSVDKANVPLELFLDALLNPFFLSYELVNEQYVMIKNSKTLRFKIMDEATQTALPFAVAKPLASDVGGVSNQHGILKLSLSDPRSQRLEFSYLGYERQSIFLDTLAYQDTILVTLRSKATELSELVVFEYLNPGVLLNAASNQISIHPQEMDILPGLAEPDILLSAQMLPGIIAADESASGISFRGSDPGQSFYYWNDIQIFNPAHYFGNISSFIPSAIGSLDIYKNNIPLQYGGVSSGLMRITSRSETSLKAEANVNLTHADVYVNAPLPKKAGQLMLTGRRSFNDLVLTPTYQSLRKKIFEGSTTAVFQDGITENSFDYNSQIVFSDINAVWSIDTFAKNAVKLSLIRSHNSLSFDTESEDALGRSVQNNDVHNTGGSAFWKHDWHPNYTTELTVSRSQYQLEYGLRSYDSYHDRGYAEERDNKLQNTQTKLDHQFSLNQNSQLILGHQWQMYEAENGSLFSEIMSGQAETYDFSQTDRAYIISNYLEWSSLLSDKWKVQAGARHSYYNPTGSHSLDPQAGIYFFASPSWTIKGSGGIFRQFIIASPETNFTLSNTQEQFWGLSGTLGKEPLKNQQYMLGLVLDQNGWLLDLEAYQKKVSGINSSRISSLIEPYYTAQETIQGTDVLIKKRFRMLRLWLSYSFQHSDVEIESLALRNLPSAYHIKHQFQVAATYSWKAFQWSAGISSRSGTPYTRASGFEATDDYYAPVYEAINGERLPSYHRIDCSAWYQFLQNNSSKFRGEIGLSLINVFNTNHVMQRSYYVEDNDDGDFSLMQNDSNLYGFTLNASLRFKY